VASHPISPGSLIMLQYYNIIQNSGNIDKYIYKHSDIKQNLPA